MELTPFLEQNGLILEDDFFTTCYTAARTAMADGLAGQPSSITMLPAYIRTGRAGVSEGKVLAIDAGGTNLRVGLVQFFQGCAPKLLHFTRLPMPGTRGQVSFAEYNDTIAAALAPFVKESDRIGYCFSYPCETMPNLDGRIRRFNKEVLISDSENASLADGLQAALRRINAPDQQQVAVVNDTVATMLAGNGDLGLIFGTGFNVCYAEPCHNIEKDPLLAQESGSCIINTEAGNFNQVPQPAWFYAFDATTGKPGLQTFEKAISGAYLGAISLFLLQRAAAAGCFSPAFAAQLAALPALASADVGDFLAERHGALAALATKAADQVVVTALLEALLERGASAAAAVLAAALERTGLGRTADAPARISVEGSVFFGCTPLREKLLRNMERLVAAGLGRHAVFVREENASLVGAARAALLV